MAQIRYHNFERPLESLPENYRMLGLLGPGRISGWDVISLASGNTLTFAHTYSGVNKTQLVPTAQDGPFGCVVSNQGVIVFENATVDVNVDYNVGNSNRRIDLLVMQHQHTEAAGGSAATYAIIKGGTSGPVRPGVSNVNTQVPIGEIHIKPNAADHSETIIIADPPRVGGLGLGFQTYLDTNQEWNTSEYSQSGASDIDMNESIKPGMYSGNWHLNRPDTSTSIWFLLVNRYRGTSDRMTQQAIRSTDGKSFVRGSQDGGATWTAWISLNNSDVVGVNISDLEAAVGSSTGLSGLNYSSNVYVTDATSLETAVGALDAALNSLETGQVSTNATNISNNASNISTLSSEIDDLEAAVGSSTGTAGLNYSSNNVVTDATSLEAAIGALDAEFADDMDWTAVTTFHGNWGNKAGQPRLEVAKKAGMVFLRGNIQRTGGGVIATLEDAFTLPAGFAPQIDVWHANGSNLSEPSQVAARWVVRTSGLVEISGSPTSNIDIYVSLSWARGATTNA